MSITPKEIELVQGSWVHVVKGGLTQHGVNMMARLFTSYSEIKPLWRFSEGLRTIDQIKSSAKVIAHGEKLFKTIDKAVSSLNNLGELVPILISLGARHYKYGIKEEHFTPVGKALLETLEEGLKQKFTPEVKEAWIKVYGVVTTQMVIGLEKAKEEEN